MTQDSIRSRGSARSRAAARLTYLTLRPLSALLPPEQPWALRISRLLVATIMNTLGPSLEGVDVEHVDDTLPDGRRVIGEWVRAPGTQSDSGAIYFL
ncbi:MAG: acetyl hydrolase, partial [Mycobacterium sp.]